MPSRRRCCNFLSCTCRVYERRGYFEQLISMMESGVGVEMGGNTAGIYTELAILYAKYKVDKLMEHLKLFFS